MRNLVPRLHHRRQLRQCRRSHQNKSNQQNSSKPTGIHTAQNISTLFTRFRTCGCRCLFLAPLLITGSQTPLLYPKPHPALIPHSSPFLFSPLPFSASSAHLCALRVLLASPSLQANPITQTIFHAFTQQNRMSSPQTDTKTSNPIPINKIKLSPKWFLVMVNPVK